MVRRAVNALMGAILLLGMAGPAAADVTPFTQAVAEAVAPHQGLAAYYREHGFAPLWTGGDADDEARLHELARAFANAPTHGLPAARYDIDSLRAMVSDIRTEADRARAEVAISRAFLRYANDVSSGLVNPREIDAGIKRSRPQHSAADLLGRIDGPVPAAGFRALPPSSPEYRRLLAAKLDLERTIAAGGWGEAVSGGRLERGDRGDDVVALRNRLVRDGLPAAAPSPPSSTPRWKRPCAPFSATTAWPRTGSSAPAPVASSTPRRRTGWARSSSRSSASGG